MYLLENLFFLRQIYYNEFGDVAPQKHECFDGFVQCGEFCNRKQVKTSALLHSLGYVHFAHGFDKEAYDIITDTFCLMQCKIPFTNQLYKVFMCCKISADFPFLHALFQPCELHIRVCTVFFDVRVDIRNGNNRRTLMMNR